MQIFLGIIAFEFLVFGFMIYFRLEKVANNLEDISEELKILGSDLQHVSNSIDYLEQVLNQIGNAVYGIDCSIQDLDRDN